MMGAYTAATATNFKSIDKANIVVINKIKDDVKSQQKQKTLYNEKNKNISSGLNIH